jgi:hypothetical protein
LLIGTRGVCHVVQPTRNTSEYTAGTKFTTTTTSNGTARSRAPRECFQNRNTTQSNVPYHRSIFNV